MFFSFSTKHVTEANAQSLKDLDFRKNKTLHVASTKPSALISLYKPEIMKEVIRREKEAGITPDPDIDTYMKVNTNLFGTI